MFYQVCLCSEGNSRLWRRETGFISTPCFILMWRIISFSGNNKSVPTLNTLLERKSIHGNGFISLSVTCFILGFWNLPPSSAAELEAADEGRENSSTSKSRRLWWRQSPERPETDATLRSRPVCSRQEVKTTTRTSRTQMLRAASYANVKMWHQVGKNLLHCKRNRLKRKATEAGKRQISGESEESREATASRYESVIVENRWEWACGPFHNLSPPPNKAMSVSPTGTDQTVGEEPTSEKLRNPLNDIFT